MEFVEPTTGASVDGIEILNHRDVRKMGTRSPYGFRRLARQHVPDRLAVDAQSMSTIDGSVSEQYRHGSLVIRERRVGTATWSLEVAHNPDSTEYPTRPIDDRGWFPVARWRGLVEDTVDRLMMKPRDQARWLIDNLEALDLALPVARLSGRRRVQQRDVRST